MESLVEGLRFCVMTSALVERLSLRSRVGPAGCTTTALQKGDRQGPGLNDL